MIINSEEIKTILTIICIILSIITCLLCLIGSECKKKGIILSLFLLILIILINI
jgi:uncharacterized membrane protein YphA (DoxX/SURF4 family)